MPRPWLLSLPWSRSELKLILQVDPWVFNSGHSRHPQLWDILGAAATSALSQGILWLPQEEWSPLAFSVPSAALCRGGDLENHSQEVLAARGWWRTDWGL